MRLKKPNEINQDNLVQNNTDFRPHSLPPPSIYPLEQQKTQQLLHARTLLTEIEDTP